MVVATDFKVEEVGNELRVLEQEVGVFACLRVIVLVLLALGARTGCGYGSVEFLLDTVKEDLVSSNGDAKIMLLWYRINCRVV